MPALRGQVQAAPLPVRPRRAETPGNGQPMPMPEQADATPNVEGQQEKRIDALVQVTNE